MIMYNSAVVVVGRDMDVGVCRLITLALEGDGHLVLIAGPYYHVPCRHVHVHVHVHVKFEMRKFTSNPAWNCLFGDLN